MEPGIRIEARGLGFAYGRAKVLEEVDFTLARGELVGVIGPNGSGKSTLLGLLSGLLKPARGRVLLDGEDIARLSRKRVARLLGLVPQAPQLAPGFSVLETVLSGRFALMGQRLFESQTDLDAARKMLETTGLTALADRPAGGLSGGERQRLALARSLAAGPSVLLLDEPTSALDLKHQLKIMKLLKKLSREDGAAVLMVSHDLNLAAAHCQRLVLIHQGRVLAQGPPHEVITSANLATAYQVRAVVDADPVRGRPRATLVED